TCLRPPKHWCTRLVLNVRASRRRETASHFSGSCSLAVGAPLHVEHFLCTAMGALEGLELVIRSGRVRLKTCEVHGAAAIAQREQERIAQRTLGRRRGHVVSLRLVSTSSLAATANHSRGMSLAQTIDLVYVFF